MRPLDVALVTCQTLPEPDPDERLLSAALERAGIACEVLPWDIPDIDWSGARLTVMRSCWNYPQRFEAFLEWVESTSRVTELWNPPPVARWNAHKGYLLELERRGVPVAPTELLRRGSTASLDEVVSRRGWTDVVIKPAVSAASYRTLRAGADQRDAGEGHLRELVAERDVLVQRYLPSVEEHGERAVVWIAGEVTHAVRKNPRFAGDDESVSEALPIASDEAALARRAVSVVGKPMLYARVDVAPGPDGPPVVMELELIEPSLFFTQSPAALDRFVAAVRRRLGGAAV